MTDADRTPPKERTALIAGAHYPLDKSLEERLDWNVRRLAWLNHLAPSHATAIEFTLLRIALLRGLQATETASA